jgi:SWI/SNF-related matrix-associated actin-dependent regulator of chromatin subfamily B protein 1
MLREHRANKRQLNRRGGPALPDLKDRLRTVRSLIVHAAIPGASDTFANTGIIKARRANRVRPGRGGAGARADGDPDSDSEESDDSAPDSPAPSNHPTSAAATNPGTTRTRGIRNAANAAIASMRGAYGRSQTPDTPGGSGGAIEPRSAGRKSLLREESVAADDEPPASGNSLIVRLRLPKAKFRAWVERQRASEYPLSGYASLPVPTAVAATATSAAASGSSAARGTPQRQTSAATGKLRREDSAAKKYAYDPATGRIDVDVWPSPHDPTVSSTPLPTSRALR